MLGKDRSHAYDLILREVAQGRQAILCSLVEESEKLDVRAAVEASTASGKHLSSVPGGGFTVA